MTAVALQRDHSRHEVVHGLRWRMDGHASGAGCRSPPQASGRGDTARSQARLCVAAQAWGVERSNVWAARFRRLTRDEAQLAETLAGLPCVVFTIPMLECFVELIR